MSLSLVLTSVGTFTALELMFATVVRVSVVFDLFGAKTARGMCSAGVEGAGCSGFDLCLALGWQQRH